MNEEQQNHLATAQQQTLACRRMQTALALSSLPQAEPASALYPAWRSHVNRHHVYDLAVQGNVLWMATPGGVVRWQMEDPKVKYTHYASEHGLPGNSFERIAVDGKGHPWVAGRRVGLSYFDGIYWQTFNHHKAPTSEILSLSADAEGVVWVGTSSGLGNIRWHDGQAQWHPFDLSDAPLPLPEIRALAVDHQHGLWLGTMWGLYCYSFKDQSWQHITQRDGLPDNVISCLRFAPDGALWIGTVRGLSLLQNGEIQPVPGIAGLVKSIAFDSVAQSTWLVVGENLWRECNGTWARIADVLSPVESCHAAVVAADGEGRVWAGFQTGLVQAAPRMNLLSAPQPGELLASGIQVLAVDSQERVWAGTVAELWIYEYGAWRCCRPGNEIEFALEGITQIVASLRGDVWVGSWVSGERGGLRRFIGTTEIPLLSCAPVPIDALTSDCKRNLWVVSSGSVWRFNGKTWHNVTTLPTPSIFAQTTFVDERSVLWLGTQAGLYRYVDGRWTAYLAEIEVNALAQTADGVLWIGTSEGLWKIQGEGDVSLCEQTTALPSQEITSLAITADGSLWIGTTEGLAFIAEKVASVWNTMNSGLTHNHILALAAVKHGVWIGTVNGVSWFHMNQEES